MIINHLIPCCSVRGVLGVTSGLVAPDWEEDFSGYGVTADLTSNETGGFNADQAAGDAFDNGWRRNVATDTQGSISLDTSAGLGSLTQSMRYGYLANSACTNFTVGRRLFTNESGVNSIAALTTANWFAFEYIFKFDAAWTTDNPDCGGGRFPDHKTLEVHTKPSSERWEVKIGAGQGFTIQQSWPENNVGNNEANINQSLGYGPTDLWNNTWFGIRIWADNITTHTNNGTWKIWFSRSAEALLQASTASWDLAHSETGITYGVGSGYPNPGTALTGTEDYWVGFNRNLGMKVNMGWNVGRLRLWHANVPEWAV